MGAGRCDRIWRKAIVLEPRSAPVGAKVLGPLNGHRQAVGLARNEGIRGSNPRFGSEDGLVERS